MVEFPYLVRTVCQGPGSLALVRVGVRRILRIAVCNRGMSCVMFISTTLLFKNHGPLLNPLLSTIKYDLALNTKRLVSISYLSRYLGRNRLDAVGSVIPHDVYLRMYFIGR